MEPQNREISKVTKVLVHKIHGGRKKDSKFWNEQAYRSEYADDDQSIPISNDSIKHSKLRRTAQLSLFPFATCLIVLIVLICVRPDLFPFLDYHSIYSALGPIVPDEKTIELNEKPPERTITIPEDVKPRHHSQSITLEPNKNLNSIPPTPNNDLTDGIQQISLSGKVFRWKDQDGKMYYSNTNFPLDNETLQVKTDEKTFQNVLKISLVNNKINVPVKLRNNGRSANLNMILDTKIATTTVPYKYLDMISATYGEDVTSQLSNGKLTLGKKAFIDICQVGSEKEINFNVTGAQIVAKGNSGILGNDFLKNRIFKVDFDGNFLVWM